METLIIILVTVIITLSCIRLGESIVMSSVPVVTTYYTTERTTTETRGKFLTTTEEVLVENRPQIETTYLEASVPIDKYYDRTLNPRYVRDNRIKIRSPISERRVLPFIIRGKARKKISNMTKQVGDYKNTAIIKMDPNLQRL